MENNEQAEFSFVIPSGRLNNPDYVEELHRIIRDMQDRPNCNVQIRQMVEITGEPDRVEHARDLLYRSFFNSNRASNQDKRASGA